MGATSQLAGAGSAAALVGGVAVAVCELLQQFEDVGNYEHEISGERQNFRRVIGHRDIPALVIEYKLMCILS
jgi:hypothetical protein